ncbi:MAG TPA: type II toxin-antitoxin system CcdA family antitoxin [Allosphingosinicella sp.]|jgi:antitoxin CcdA
MATTARKPKDCLIPTKLLDEAKRLGVAVAGRSEDEIRHAVREAWIEENRAAIEASNAWVEKHGLPLEKYRQF